MTNSLWPNDTIWEQIWVNIGSGNGLLPDGTKPLPEPMLTCHQWSFVFSLYNSFTGSAWDISSWYKFENYNFEITATFPRANELNLITHSWNCFTGSVLTKVFWAPVLWTSGSWNLPVRMEGSLVRNFNNYYILLIYVFDGCSNRFDPCDHFNLVCCCLSPVLISDKRSCWKISQRLKPIWLDVEMLVLHFWKINQCCRDACQISEQLEDSRPREKLRQDFLCDIESAQDLFSVQQTQVW